MEPDHPETLKEKLTLKKKFPKRKMTKNINLQLMILMTFSRLENLNSIHALNLLLIVLGFRTSSET